MTLPSPTGLLARAISELPMLKALSARGCGVQGNGANLLLRSLRHHRVITVDLSRNLLGTYDDQGEKGPVLRALKALLKSNGE